MIKGLLPKMLLIGFTSNQLAFPNSTNGRFCCSTTETENRKKQKAPLCVHLNGFQYVHNLLN